MHNIIKIAQDAATRGFLSEDDLSFLENLKREYDQRSQVVDEYNEWVEFYAARKGSYSDFLKAKSLLAVSSFHGLYV